MSPRTVTVVLLFAVAAGLVGWDVIAATNRERGDTISEVTLGFLRRYPAAGMGLALALGIVLGHLAWAQEVCP